MTTKNLNNNLRIVVLISKLLEAMNSLQMGVGSSNTSLPILRNVLMRVSDGKIIFTTTDLELVVEYYLSGKILQDGVFTIPFLVLNNIVRNLTNERLTLEQSGGNKINILTDNYEAFILGQSADDFPIIPTIKNTDNFLRLSAEIFRDVISTVSVACEYSEIRPETSGVYMCFNNHQLCFVATDGFRLTERILGPAFFETNLDKISCIIPLRTISDLLRIITKNDEKVEIYFESNQVFLKTNTQSIISRLIDGTFPDYNQVMPKEFNTEALVNRLEFIRAVKAVSPLSGRTNDITVKAGDNKKFLEISSKESSLGENMYKIPAKISGTGFSLMFNWRYVLDGLKIYKGEEIIFGANGKDKPVGIKSSSEPFLTYIAMPIKS